MVIKPKSLRYDLFQEAGYAMASHDNGAMALRLSDLKGSQAWNDSIRLNPADIGFQYFFYYGTYGRPSTLCIYWRMVK